MSELGGLLDFARKKELDRQLFPFRVLEQIAQQLTGESGSERYELPKTKSSRKSGEDILAEFMPMIEAMRGG